MPLSERKWKWNVSDVWRTVKRLIYELLGTEECDELQRNCNREYHGTNSQRHRRAGRASSLRTTISQRRHDTEYFDTKGICELRARSAMLEKKIERLDQHLQGTLAKLTSVEQAAKQQTARKTQAIEHLEDKVAKLERDLQAAVRNMVDGCRDNQRNKPLARAPIGSADGISVADVAELVKALNAQLEQTSCLIADSLSYRQSPISDRESEVSNELRDYLGLWLYHDLRRRSSEGDTKPDQLITQIVIQTGLVNACNRIINGWTLPDIGQGVADARRAQARTYTSAKSNSQGINEKYLTSLLWELINAVGGSLESDEQLLPMCQEDVKGIANRAVALHRIINEEVTPLKLVTYTIPCDTEFDPSRMEDTEGHGGEAGPTFHDKVICTIEMGLQCRESGNSRQEYSLTMKAKVILASTLEVQES